MDAKRTGLVVVSNRLPVCVTRDGELWDVRSGSGGLVTAMAPVLKNRGGTWIGWSGIADDKGAAAQLDSFSRTAGYELMQVGLSQEDIADFYYGFANEIIWPLFHDFQSLCNFYPHYWQAYLRVNTAFAQTVMDSGEHGDYVWVHDYHLMHVAKSLKEQGSNRRIGFFLHIPFPPVDNFVKLPWRSEVIEALLEYDLVGFHTYRDRRNFMQCVHILFPEAKSRGRGPVLEVAYQGRCIRVGTFPISIDYKSFASLAKTAPVIEKKHELQSALRNRTIILGVDRLDYTKGIPLRLEAFRTALRMYPELQGKISLLQIVVPSREEIPMYANLKREIERLVGEINGQFSRPGYVPVHYQYRSLGREELVAYYRAASMALVTPLRDGMNLVAKEYCACSVDREGILFLSEFAGAAAQLRNGALLVNPFDVEGVATSIYEAFYMDKAERKLRMDRMREGIRKNDIFRWVDSFLSTAFSRQLGDFPPTDVSGGETGRLFS